MPPPSGLRPRATPPSMRAMAGSLTALYGLWLLYVAKLSGPECLAGGGAAVLAMVAVERVRTERLAHISLYGRWLMLLWRLPGYILRDTYMLLRLLARRWRGHEPQGVIRAVRYRRGGEDAHSAARRALLVALATAPPNSLVIGLDPRRDWLLVHQAVMTDISPLIRILGMTRGAEQRERRP